MTRTQKIIKQVVALAQQMGRDSGFKVGDSVAHPDEPKVCNLLEIRGDTALIGWKHILREFPLSELFDPNVALREAVRIQGGVN